jgi:hypothetical protein
VKAQNPASEEAGYRVVFDFVVGGTRIGDLRFEIAEGELGVA